VTLAVKKLTELAVRARAASRNQVVAPPVPSLATTSPRDALP
jgi:hypothetical protein